MRKTTSVPARYATGLCIILTATLSACGDDAPAPVELPAWGLTEDLSLGGPTDPAGPLNRVAAMLAQEDGGVWILEPSERDIRVHGPDGKLTQTVGSSGEGPGQFTLPGKLGWWGTSKDTVWVSDQGQRRLSLFDARGTFVRSMNMPFVTYQDVLSISQPAAVLSDGTALQLATYKASESEWKDFPIVRYGVENGAVTKEFLRLDRTGTVALRDKDRIVSTTVHPLSDAPLVAYAPDASRVVIVDRTVSGDASDDAASTPAAGQALRIAPAKAGEVNVLVLGTAGETIWERSYPFEPVPVTPAEADSLLAPRIASFLQFTGMEGSVSEAEAEALFREAVKIPPTRPGVESVQVAADGSIWLSWATAPGTGDRWTVLSASGDPVAEVTYPETLDVRAVGKDWLWAAKAGEGTTLELVRYKVGPAAAKSTP